MNDFDDELRDRLESRAGGTVNVTAGHDAVLARAGSIRRRRGAIVGGGTLTALVVGGLVLLAPGGEDTLAPADPTVPRPTTTPVVPTIGDTLPTDVNDRTSTSAPAATIGGATPTESSVAGTTVPLIVVTPPPLDPSTTTPAETTTSTASGSTPTSSSTTSSTTAPGSTATSTLPSSSSSSTSSSSSSSSSTSSSSSSSSSTSSSSTTSPGVAPFTRTYDSSGGSITVDWDGSSLSLLAVSPAAGFDGEIEEQSATRVRVRFRGEPDDSRIEVRVEGGELRVDIS